MFSCGETGSCCLVQMKTKIYGLSMEDGGCDARGICCLAMERQFAVLLWEGWSLFSCGKSGRCLAVGRLVVV